MLPKFGNFSLAKFQLAFLGVQKSVLLLVQKSKLDGGRPLFEKIKCVFAREVERLEKN